MHTISLCMIVKNEEEVLARCLDSVKDVADEIVIVDTGSSDSTKGIAARYTDKVFDYPWNDDFAAARNESFGHATGDFILWLDADDVLRDDDLEKWRMLKATLDRTVDVVMAPYHVSFDRNDEPTFTYYRERVVRNGCGFSWEGRVHEAITPRGNIRYTDAAVCHRKLRPGDPDRNLRIFERMQAEGQPLDDRQQYYYARELYDHARYAEAAALLSSWLERGTGWVENLIGGSQILAYCHYRLGEEHKALLALLGSLAFDTPRAEICCDIGRHFFDRQQYERAIYWYETARTRKPDPRSGAFVLPECYGYLPCIQLCVCYDRLGQGDKAAEYNEQAAFWKPGDEAVEANRAYFRSKGINPVQTNT